MLRGFTSASGPGETTVCTCESGSGHPGVQHLFCGTFVKWSEAYVLQTLAGYFCSYSQAFPQATEVMCMVHSRPKRGATPVCHFWSVTWTPFPDFTPRGSWATRGWQSWWPEFWIPGAALASREELPASWCQGALSRLRCPSFFSQTRN